MARFPEKAVDLNKLPNKDEFWKMSIAEANKRACLRGPEYCTDIGGLIFYLNMVALVWRDIMGGKR